MHGREWKAEAALQLALISILCHAGLLMHVVLRSSLI
jgi:hypothetical protein